MPKRSAQTKLEYYASKIRRIEEKQKRRRIIPPLNSSSDDEGNEDHSDAINYVTAEPTPPEPLPDTGLDSTEIATQNENFQLEPTASLVPDLLDPELLSALGESTEDSPEYGDNIHDNLIKLWLPLLKKGISKETKDKLIKDYLIPDNCRLLQAPKLNAEISAAVPDMVRNRDKSLCTAQQQLGSGITAINRGIDLLLKSDNKVQAMKHFSNGCRLLCDSHYLSTQSRIKLITPSLDKSFLHMISESERDELLFGSNLSEKIKTAKAVEKQGLSIKKPNKPQKSTAPQASSSRPNIFQGNWYAPPRYPSSNRGGRGSFSRPPTTSGARRSYTSPAQPIIRRGASQDKIRAPAHTRR